MVSKYAGPILFPWHVQTLMGAEAVCEHDFEVRAESGEVVAQGLTEMTARHVVEVHNRWLETEAI